jgi:hypothetical protein
MAGRKHTDYYKKLLLDFIAEPDPLFSMLQWLTQRMMELESQSKAGAPKGKHCAERKTHFSGTRVGLGASIRGSAPFICWCRNYAEAAISRSLSPSGSDPNGP